MVTKRRYLSPALRELPVCTQGVLCGSPVVANDAFHDDFDLDTTYETMME